MADVMTDDEALALMEAVDGNILDAEDEAALLAMSDIEGTPVPASMYPDEPVPVAPEPVDTGLVPQGLEHALKGYPKMAAGFADMPNMISSAMTYPQRKILNAMGVDEKYTDKAVVPSLSEQEFMQPVNEWMNNTPGIDKDDTVANLAQTGVEWGGLGPVSAVRKGASAIPDLMMAGGAMVGDYFDGDGPWGEVAGGLTGLLAALRGKGGSSEALKILEDTATSSGDEVVENVRKALAADESGTLADLSRDQGVMDAEAAVSSGKNAEEYRNIELARQKQIADEVRAPFGKADPDAARVAGQERIDRIVEDVIPQRVKTRQQQVEIPLQAEQLAAEVADEIPQAAAVEAGLNQARAQERAGVAAGNTVEAAREAEAARAAFESTETLAESSIKGSDAWNAEKAADKAANVQPKWDEFDAIESIPSTGYKSTVEGFIDALPESQKVQFKEMFSALTRPFRNKKITDMKPKQIQNYIKDIQRELSKPRGGQRSAAHDDLQKLYDELRDQLGADVPVFDDAMQAEAAWKARFDAGGVVDEAASGAPELFFKGAGEGDEVGAVAARIIKDAEIPGMPAVQGDRLRALARRFKNGLPDDQFLLEYESIMDTLPPELRNQAQAVVDTGRGLEAAGAAETAATKTAVAAGKQADAATTEAKVSTTATANEVARLEKAIAAEKLAATQRGDRLTGAVEKSNLNKYVKDRKGTILKLLKNPDDVSGLVELQRSVKKLGEIDSFNANLGDVILERLSTKGRQAGLREATGQAPVLTTAAIPEFNKIGASLVEAGTDPKVIQGIREKLYKLSTAEQRATARKLLMSDNNFVQDLLSSGTAAATLKLLPGSSLVLAGAVRRAVKAAFTAAGRGDKATLAAIDDFMLNPDKYLKAAENAKNPAQVQQTILSELVAASQTSQAIQN